MQRDEIRQVICNVFNQVKRVSLYTFDNVTDESYLGGDLGFDSIEMLEAWVDIQRTLDIRIGDDEMIDILTIGQVLDLVHQKVIQKG